MRKILIGILTLLLVIMAGLVIFKGLSVGNITILSAKQIVEENDKLTNEISDVEALMNSTYPATTEELDTSVCKLLAAEEEYLDLANVSTKSELNKASTVETYTVEFLWTRLGRHATQEGVNLSYTPSGTSINFTVLGDYIPILSFISAIENDSKLGFRIENFKLTPNSGNLQATFTTRNVNIKSETVSSGTSTQNTTENTNRSTSDNTEANTTENNNKADEQNSTENQNENTDQNQTQAQ